MYSLNRALLHLNSSGSEELSSGSEEYVLVFIIFLQYYPCFIYSERSESSQPESAESADECETIPQSGVLEIEILIVLIYCFHVNVHAVYTTDAPTAALIGDPKVIVSMPQLMQLAPRVCVMTHCLERVTLRNEYKGCGVLVHMNCSAGHHYTWSSSPQHVDCRGRAVYSNNLLFSSACVVSGSSVSKIQLMFDFMGLKTITSAMHYRYVCVLLALPHVHTIMLYI